MSHTTTPTTSTTSPGNGHPILAWEYGDTNPPVGTLLSADGKRTPLPVQENHKNTNVKLFHEMKIHDITFKNRIWVSPMCQYTSVDGFFSDWHLVHLGQFAVGGAALVMTEATAVSPEGRISPNDTGLWKDEHIPQLRRITDFIRSQHSVPAIQLAHAGRKASTFPPFLEAGRVAVDEKNGGWPETVVAPSPIEWDKNWIKPKELSKEQIQKLVKDFADATVRAENAGFDVVEIHGAHGYLIHEFLSPLSNHRTDEYGGSLANRARFVIEVIRAVRAVWPRNKVLGARFSATDWVDGGFNLEEFIQVVGMLIPEGIDFVDVSSGGQHPAQKIPVGPGYQVFAAEAVKKAYGDKLNVGSVGLLTDPQQCEDILQKGQADFVLLARELLRQPHWPLRAAKALGVNIAWAPQYQRAKI